MQYMVGGGSTRVHRGNKPYPGATRFMQPPRPPVNWRKIIGNICIAALFIISVIPLLWVMVAVMG